MLSFILTEEQNLVQVHHILCFSVPFGMSGAVYCWYCRNDCCNQGRIKGGATGAIAPGPPLQGGPP